MTQLTPFTYGKTNPISHFGEKGREISRCQFDLPCVNLLRHPFEVDGGVPLSALHDCCLLTLLTYQPPDRVRLMRTLRLGTSLKRAGEGLFQLNVASPAAHKTAAFFGATRTTLPTAICKRITAYINAAGLEDGDFLFYARDDASESLKPPAWTRLVKACFKRHSAHKVALAPKELR